MSYDPGHAALPWALIRFLLQVCLASRVDGVLLIWRLYASMGDIEKYEFVGESLERVSRCICRCQLLEKLYLGGNTAATAQFKSALVRLYGLILLYLLKAKGFFDKKRSSTCSIRRHFQTYRADPHQQCV